MSEEEIKLDRYAKFRALGQFEEFLVPGGQWRETRASRAKAGSCCLCNLIALHHTAITVLVMVQLQRKCTDVRHNTCAVPQVQGVRLNFCRQCMLFEAGLSTFSQKLVPGELPRSSYSSCFWPGIPAV